MVCNITITGNLGRDPELKALESGQMVTKFTVAARQGKVQGQDPPALWFTVEVWGQQAPWIADNLRKGEGVCVSGRLLLQQWTDRQSGEVREALTVKNAYVEKLFPPLRPEAVAAAAPAQQAAAPVAAPVERAAAPAYQQATAPHHPLAAPPAAASQYEEPPY